MKTLLLIKEILILTNGTTNKLFAVAPYFNKVDPLTANKT